MEQTILQLFNGNEISIDTSTFIRLAVILVLMIVACIALKIAYKKLVKRYDLDSDIRKAQMLKIALRVVRIIVVLVGVILMLQAIGINLVGLSGVFGVVVILLVFAVKDALQDVFNGIVIMSDKYFTVGDAVEFEGQEGIVISFTARTTKIEYLQDRSVLSVANRNISKIRKLTHLVDIDLPLSYEMSGKDAYEILNGICAQIRLLEGVESCELKGTQDFGGSAILYKIRFFCEPHDRPDIRRAVVRTIQEGLENAGISIPYQQIDIHEK